MPHRCIAGGSSNSRKNGVSPHDGLKIPMPECGQMSSKTHGVTFTIIRIQVEERICSAHFTKIAKIVLAESEDEKFN